MAKKKSKGGEVGDVPTSGSKGRLDIGIEPAENGFVVRICKEDGGKNPSYQSKRYVASSHRFCARGLPSLGGSGIASSFLDRIYPSDVY